MSGDPLAGYRVDHVQVDEETQTLRYLADIAMMDLELLPDPSKRRVREGSLAEAYQNDVAARHALEKANDAAPVEELRIETVSIEEYSQPSVPQAGVQPPDDRAAREFTKKGE